MHFDSADPEQHVFPNPFDLLNLLVIDRLQLFQVFFPLAVPSEQKSVSLSFELAAVGHVLL